MANRPTRPLLSLALLSAWIVVVVGPPCLFYAWRGGRLAELTAPQVRSDWEAFRDDMRRQSGRDGPVQRKVPKSPEPPELVWLRNHAPLAVVAWMTLGGVLGGVLAALLLGVARSPSEQQPAGHGHRKEQNDGDGKHAGERGHG